MKPAINRIAILLSIAVLICTSTCAFAVESPALDTIKKGVYGIIKTAGNLGVMKACEMVLPEIFCKVVVAPVMTAIYDEVPALRPSEDDTQEQLNEKADRTIQYLQKSQSLQQMMLKNFNTLQAQQVVILKEIEGLGATQEQIQKNLEIVIRILARQQSVTANANRLDKRIELRKQAAELQILEQRLVQLSGYFFQQAEASGQVTDQQLAKMKHDSEDFIAEIREKQEATKLCIDYLQDNDVPLETLEKLISSNDQLIIAVRAMVDNLKMVWLQK